LIATATMKTYRLMIFTPVVGVSFGTMGGGGGGGLLPGGG
jgi:hypothetical protein